MDVKELYEFLDIESPADFEYYENLADLLECGDDIEYEALCGLLEEVDRDVLLRLIKDYFEEISDFVPQNESELFLLMDHARLAIAGACGNGTAAVLADELDKFRLWYSRDSQVVCTPLESLTEMRVPLRDALTLCRLEKIDGEKYDYDFSGALDYSPEEYVMSIGDIDMTEQ